MVAFVELCAGTAAVGLRAITGRPVHPLTGYMGGKRRWATDIVGLFGHRKYDHLVLVDAGPWGDVWTTLQDTEQRAAVADLFDRFVGWDPSDLWRACASFPPDTNPAVRAFQYLWLQARSAGTIPVWWDGDRWVSPSGARLRADRAAVAGTSQEVVAAWGNAGERMGLACEKGAASKEEARRARADAVDAQRQVAAGTLIGGAGTREVGRKSRGIQTTATMARRVRDLDQVPWERVTVIHGRVEDVSVTAESDVYFDPPYANAPRYAVLFPRAAVLTTCRKHADGGARVVVSEAEELPLKGWFTAPLRNHGKPEFVTCSFQPSVNPSPQVGLPIDR